MDTNSGETGLTNHADNTVGELDTESFVSTVDTSDLVGNIYARVGAMLTRL